MYASVVRFRGFSKSLKLHKIVYMSLLIPCRFLYSPKVKNYYSRNINVGILIVKRNSYKQGIEERFGLDDH